MLIPIRIRIFLIFEIRVLKHSWDIRRISILEIKTGSKGGVQRCDEKICLLYKL